MQAIARLNTIDDWAGSAALATVNDSVVACGNCRVESSVVQVHPGTQHDFQLPE